MNKLLILLAFIGLSFSTLHSQLFEEAPDETVEIETRELGDFDKVIVSRGINVTFTEGLLTKAEIHIQNTTPDNVIIDQKGMTLNIRMRAKSYKDVSVNVFLTIGVNTIREINSGTGSSVFSDILLKGDQLKLEAGGDGSIELQVEMSKIVANTSSSLIKLTGTTNYLDLNVSAGGRFEGTQLKATEVDASANLGSAVKLFATEKLVAKAATGAKIEYTGDPDKVEVRTSLGGKVEKLK
ncbi:MAG TPA: head GIN domain-containing protein [Marinilabiliaceae bacterium]|nr:head GIN domain-containing protein [Marinilabiliaceae bacterium]